MNSNLPPDASTTPTTEDTLPSVKTNGKPMDKPISKSVSFQDFVVVRECESQVDEDRERSDSAGLEDINIDLVGLSAVTNGNIIDTEELSSKIETICLGKDLDIEDINSEMLRFGQLGISDSETDQKATEETVQHIRNLDLPEPLDVKIVILQEDKPDSNQTRTDVNEVASAKDAESYSTAKADRSALSTAESETRRSITIKPDVNKEAETPDVKCSKSEGPPSDTSEPEATNKGCIPLGTEGGHFQVGTNGEEGKIKIIVTDTDGTNTDSTNEDAGAQDMAERATLKIRSETPQRHGTKQADETKNTNKDPGVRSGNLNMPYDGEDISTNLDNVSQDDSNPPALLNPEINKQAVKHSDLSHLPANSSNIQT